ncbi:MAG: trigger factor family protein, partial [Lachnospiraceae bacterium]|nr:trigger factor family protein [Lachnospiraceae bacterium]
MSVKVEKLEHNMAMLTIEAPPEDLEKSMQKAYHKLKGRINIPGFRKGKAPKQLIEKMYGPEVFYEEAANDLIYTAYADALEETEEEIVSRPKISVTQIEKGKPFIFTAEVALRPEVELGKYKGVKVSRIDTSVSDSEVEEELEKERKRN